MIQQYLFQRSFYFALNELQKLRQQLSQTKNNKSGGVVANRTNIDVPMRLSAGHMLRSGVILPLPLHQIKSHVKIRTQNDAQKKAAQRRGKDYGDESS